MDDKQFDKYIREQLSERKSTKVGDWNDMQQRLIDEDILQDQVDEIFDSVVKEEMSNIKADYNPSHWEILRQKLITESYLKKRIFVIKGIELSMLFLLIWTVTSIVPLKNDLYVVQKYKPMVEEVSELVSAGLDKVVRAITGNSTQVRNLTPVNSIHQDTDQVWKYIPLRNLEKRGTSLHTDGVENTESMPMAQNYIQLHTRDIRVDKVGKSIEIIKIEKSETILAITAGGSLNYIEAPFQNAIGLKPEHHNTIDYQLGVEYGMKQGNVELFTGMKLFNASYRPTISRGLIDSYQEEDIPLSEIEKISYKFINIPLGMKVHFIDHDSWSVYGMAAININLLAGADYSFRELTRAERKIAELGASQISGAIRSNLDSKLSQGLFQGAGFLNSLSTSTSVGLGAVKRLSHGTAIFAQSSYTKNFSITGIGAQDENIDNLRLDLGVRFSL